VFFDVADAIWRHGPEKAAEVLADEASDAVAMSKLERRLKSLPGGVREIRIEKFCQESPLEFVVVMTASVGMLKVVVALAEQVFDLVVKVRDDRFNRLLKEARVARELAESPFDPLLVNSLRPGSTAYPYPPESVEIERWEPA
jgi:hypothetical protein